MGTLLTSPDIVELNALPHDAARDLVATGAPIYLMVNPVEYHGPHLPLYTDFILSLASARDLHSRLKLKHPEWPMIVAAPLHMGVDPVPGQGSIPFSYSHVRRAVIDSCKGLAALGAKRVLLMTFHGAPLHGLALNAGVNALNEIGVQALAPFNFVLQEMLDYRPGHFAQAVATIEDPKMREHVARTLDLDFHGGFFETSIMLRYHPEVVSPRLAQVAHCPEIKPLGAFALVSRLATALGFPKLAAELKFAAYGSGWLKLEPSPGYTGWPSLANAKAGGVFVDRMMQLYTEGAENAFANRASPPQPIMKWVGPLSFGGRIAP